MSNNNTSMLNLAASVDRRIRFAPLLAVVLVAFVAHMVATAWLNTSYTASAFPVPYHVAQLSFSADQLRGWYGELLRMGTLGAYVRTQFVDFAFIASVAVLHPAVLLLIGRGFNAASRARKLLVGAAALSLVAPAADAAENLMSFVMLAQPLDFPAGLALVYSSLAALKFAMFTFAYVAAALGLAWLLWSTLTRNKGLLRAA